MIYVTLIVLLFTFFWYCTPPIIPYEHHFWIWLWLTLTMSRRINAKVSSIHDLKNIDKIILQNDRHDTKNQNLFIIIRITHEYNMVWIYIFLKNVFVFIYVRYLRQGTIHKHDTPGPRRTIRWYVEIRMI